MSKYKPQPTDKPTLISNPLPIYGGTLNIVFCYDIAVAAPRVLVDPELKSEAATTPACSGGMACIDITKKTGPEWWLFFSTYCVNQGIIAHECFHLTHKILNKVGVPFYESNHEPFAYLLTYLVNRVTREAKKSSVKIYP